MEWIDKKNTFVLLIGIETYKDESLHELPAAFHNISALGNIFRNDKYGFAKKQVKRIVDLQNKSEFVEILLNTLEQDNCKNILIYFSGHGVLDDDDNFYLTFSNSSLSRIKSQGLRIRDISSILSEKNVNVILILDCCFSERAFEEFQQRNFYVMASSARNETSKYPMNEEPSVFTEELISIIENGVTIEKGNLCINDIFDSLYQRLLRKNMPLPKRSVRNEVGNLFIFENAFKSEIIQEQEDIEYLNEIFNAIKVHNPDIIEKKNKLSNHSILYFKEYKKIILNSLPSVISYPLKNLIPDTGNIDKAYLQSFYCKIVKFISFISISDVYKSGNNRSVFNIAPYIGELDHSACIRWLNSLQEVEIDFFMVEFKDAKVGIIDQVNKLEYLFNGDCPDYLEIKKEIITLISSLAFFVNYNLLSVRFIDLDKRLVTSKLKHEISVLRGEAPGNYSRDITFLKESLLSNTVLFVRGGQIDYLKEGDKYLNLWPYIIDANSYTPKNSTPEIHFYVYRDGHDYYYQEVNLFMEKRIRPYTEYDETLSKEEIRSNFAAFESLYK